MVAELFAGLGAFKTMFDMTKAVQDAHDVATRDRAVIELQKEILTAQMQQATLIERVRALEQKVASYEAWDHQKQRYQLTKLPPATFVMCVKDGMEQGEPSHYACARCFEHSKRSVLHDFGTQYGILTWKCYECGTTFDTGTFQAPARDDDSWRS